MDLSEAAKIVLDAADSAYDVAVGYSFDLEAEDPDEEDEIAEASEIANVLFGVLQHADEADDAVRIRGEGTDGLALGYLIEAVRNSEVDAATLADGLCTWATRLDRCRRANPDAQPCSPLPFRDKAGCDDTPVIAAGAVTIVGL